MKGGGSNPAALFDVMIFMKYTISVDKASQSIAVFQNAFDLVRDFEPYTDEQAGIDKAKEFIKAKSTEEPEIVYPKITKMVLTMSKPRRRK